MTRCNNWYSSSMARCKAWPVFAPAGWLMNMKVYLDDERAAPDGWTRVYWPEEAIELLKTGAVHEISLDHDLGDDEHGTG